MKASKLRPEDFPVDIWLVFGSFVYGFEGEIIECEKEAVVVRLSTRSVEEAEELSAFFDEISANPRDLVKSEIRIYCESPEWGEGVAAPPINLFTGVAPQVPPGEKPRIRFSALQGVAPGDEQAWRDVVEHLGNGGR